jgi:hypothetical protein
MIRGLDDDRRWRPLPDLEVAAAVVTTTVMITFHGSQRRGVRL